MEQDVEPLSLIEREGGLLRRVEFWFLLSGNRLAVAGSIVAGVVVIIWVLISVGLLDVGPQSSAPTLFASGLASGIVTLVTIALSINQFILSRLFGAPNDYLDRLDGTNELRRTVERIADAPSSPNDPGAFLSMTANTLHNRAMALATAINASDWAAPDSVVKAVETLAEYGNNIENQVEADTPIVDVFDVVIGSEYAQNLTAIRHLRNVYEASLSEDALQEIEAVIELIETIAIARQFFKVLSLQQDFAKLSRLVVYTGIGALLSTIMLTLLYRSESVTIPESLLTPVISVGLGVIVTPLAVFVAYILRASTIGGRSVSVGSFTPPESR